MEQILADKEKALKVAGLIMKHEGFRLDPYQLSYTKADGKKVKEKFFTGGVGHKMTSEDLIEFDPNWSDKEKEQYWLEKYKEDLTNAQINAVQIAAENKIQLTPTQHDVITSMIFQMGAKGVKKFKGFLGALSNGDREKAAYEMLDSSWANQTQGRAKELSEMIRNDESSN